MASGPATADLQRLSEEVARDPGSSSFLPLADAYRRLGKTQAALRVCLRGLERSPEHVEAHLLLARLYLELGDRERAADEWAVAARLDPDNFDAHRGLGFFHLERGEFSSAGRHLERAALVRPADPAVQEALSVLRRRQAREAARAKLRVSDNGVPPVSAASAAADAPEAEAQVQSQAEAPAEAEAQAHLQAEAEAQAQTYAPEASAHSTALQAEASAYSEAVPQAQALARDPARVFEPLAAEAPYLGGLLLDSRGLVLAGSFRTDNVERGEMLGAVIGAAAEEAARTAALLSIGAWRGILMETDRALLHVAPLEQDLVVLTAAARGTPAGWVLRAAARTAELARRFLEGGS